MIRTTDYIAALIVDCYKLGHMTMIPETVTLIMSNITARSSRLMGNLVEGVDDRALIVGVQRSLDDIHAIWEDGFFKLPRAFVLRKIRNRIVRSLPSNVNADQICELLGSLHDLGYLPVEIKAVNEGTRLNIRIPYMTIKNTIPKFAFLTNYLETILSTEGWKSIVLGSRAFQYLKILSDAAIRTTGNDDFVRYQAHDFSMRGMSGFVDASNNGIGHLSCFNGTDTVASIEVIEHHYGEDQNDAFGESVAATEHMVMCLGQMDNELETFRHLIQDEYPTGIISIVSDTWDFFGVITKYTVTLKDIIMARTPDSSGLGRVVFRPDSGDPVKIICGDPDAPVGTPEYKGAVECLWDVFGGTVSEQGYKILDTHVGLIYGDSITIERCIAIIDGLARKGFASINVLFGVGSFSYQYVTRDNLSIAVKATYAVIDGQGVNLLKNPKTDDGTKKSATGLLRVDKVGDEFVLREGCTPEEEQGGELKTRYRNGEFFNRTTWTEVKTAVRKELRRLQGLHTA